MPTLFQQFKVYPEELDDKLDRAIGITLPFNKRAHGRTRIQNYASGSNTGVGVFNQSYSTEDQAISNLINLILTRKGERYMQPRLGSDVPDFVFEQNTIDNRFRLQGSLIEDIKYWLPYIFINTLTVEPGDGTTPGDLLHCVVISLNFSVTESGANREITIFVGLNGQTTFELVR